MNPCQHEFNNGRCKICGINQLYWLCNERIPELREEIDELRNNLTQTQDFLVSSYKSEECLRAQRDDSYQEVKALKEQIALLINLLVRFEYSECGQKINAFPSKEEVDIIIEWHMLQESNSQVIKKAKPAARDLFYK